MSRRQPPDWLKRWSYAHRGLHGDGLTENTLPAFAAAVEAGLGIECDIQRSGDGAAMVFHDWSLERLTVAQGPFADHGAQELSEVRYREKDFGIASLDELLTLISGKVPLLIEIKSRRGYDVERSCEAVRDCLCEYAGDHAVMSFDPRVARWFRRNSPQTCAGLVMREDDHGHTRKAWQRRLAFWIAKPDFLAYHIAALPSRWVAGLRANGLPVLTWTVNTPETLERARRFADAPIAEAGGIPDMAA